MNVMKRPLFRNNGGPAMARPQNVQNQVMAEGSRLGELLPEVERATARNTKVFGQQLVETMQQGVGQAEDFKSMIDSVRGNEKPLESRYEELAGFVGEQDAQQTPESVLAMVQPTLMMTGQGAMDSGIGDLVRSMTEQVDMQFDTGQPTAMGQGVGSMLGAGQPVQGFKAGGYVQKLSVGGPPTNISTPQFEGLPDRIGAQDFQQAYKDRLNVYQQALGIDPEERKKELKSNILFDVAKSALAFGSGVDPISGENMAGRSLGAQLMSAAQPLPGAIQERLATQRQEEQGIKMGALSSAEQFMAAEAERVGRERTTAMNLGSQMAMQTADMDFQRMQGQSAREHETRLTNLKGQIETRLQNLRGLQDQEAINLQASLQQDLARLNSELTGTRDLALHEQGIEKLGIMQGYDIEKMNLGAAQKTELTKLQGAIEAEAAALERTSREMMQDKELGVRQAMQRAQQKSQKELQRLDQVWQSSENSIDRDFREKIFDLQSKEAQLDRDLKVAMQGTDIEAQKALQNQQLEVRRELQIAQQEWQSSESGLDRETKVDIVSRQIQQQVFDRLQNDRQFRTKAELEAYGLAIEEQKNKYSQLGNTLDGRMMSYVLNADNMGGYADGTMTPDNQTRYEQYVLSLTKSGWKPDPVTGQMKYSQGEKLAPAVMESLRQGNPDFYRDITKSLSRSGQVPFEDRTPQEQADYIAAYGDPNQAYSERDPEAYALGLPAPPKGLDILKLDRSILPDPNIDFSQAFGAPRVFGGMLNTVSDLFGGGLPALDVAKASNVMASLKQEVLAYMDEATDGRPSNFQITIANELIPLADNASKLFTGDEEAYEQLDKLTSKMRRSLVEQSQKWQMEAEKDPEMLQKDRVQYNNLRNTLATLETIRRGLKQNLNTSQSSGISVADYITPIE